MTQMTIQCRFFARYAELAGRERHALSAPQGATAADVVARLRAELPGGDRLPLHPMVAVNRAHVAAGHVLVDGDELALLPPLAGG